MPVPDVAAVEADHQRAGRARQGLAVALTNALKRGHFRGQLLFLRFDHRVQVLLNGRARELRSNGQHVVEQIGRFLVGNQTGPFGFQIQPLRRHVLRKQVLQGTEGLRSRLGGRQVVARGIDRHVPGG
ncbi:hypothetical protein [Hymenobacter wooponensis]|uniref:Uncharacterized protein n=1 Tax=Hymenobacter wooponensis TaxID=1525360 RepID=A0A4Z0MC92_9BACT|nr:hypothetical protein [Hymenobacter wooponensis]TGD76997.1 hypothetical protein EU557_24790 [Hymenobacter wooponensis]